MGLLQKACETYENHADLVGVYERGKEPLAPCAHMIARADMEITVNQDGNFVSAMDVDKDEPKIIIPVTEDSASRSGKNPPPHPLCDQLVYLAPYNSDRHQPYVDQLSAWANSDYSHPKLIPILKYIEQETIVNDLLHAGRIKLKNGRPENEKLLVRWRVVGLGPENSGPCWTDQTLFQSFISYYQSRKANEAAVFCMVQGCIVPPAKHHMKGIVPFYGNAKIISSNDKDNFTYRGRFSAPSQAETVGYETSQKAHNALHWLIDNQKVFFGNRAFICWEPQQLILPNPLASFLPPGLAPAPSSTPSDYQESLQHTLKGWQSELPAQSGQAIIAAFDAATTGRLAITYYNELQASDFLERLYDWDRHCCWYNGDFGIQSPSIFQIVRSAFGVQREEKNVMKLAVDDNLLKLQMQRILVCRIDRSQIPSDLVTCLTRRASNPLAFEKKLWENILFTACAVIRKYRYDKYKEEWAMALEPEKQDRSYQYGRLLAVLEKAERDTYESEEKREPNAIRMQPVFSQRPQYAARIIWERVKKAYYPRLKPGARTHYEKLIQDIFGVLSQFPEHELNRTLGDTYLMGYYLQRKDLYTKKENENRGKA